MLSYAMLCYDMLRYAVLRYAMICCAMLRCAMLCYAMLRYAALMLCYAMQSYAALCYAMLCCAMLRYAMLCYAALCYAAKRISCSKGAKVYFGMSLFILRLQQPTYCYNIKDDCRLCRLAETQRYLRCVMLTSKHVVIDNMAFHSKGRRVIFKKIMKRDYHLKEEMHTRLQ